ncbi:hypothetical protein SEA_YABOI_23 [Streptomyces phage Yaboi]|uniref:Uncharacterized protein n=1 Tax=Streptomyces phage Yaboi TaxID=2301621 RepID=A0A385UGI0_9CAUD|nr:hypothetical protein HWB86_gp023 [Streptomyces phage Yaboi]AYB70862.1 hypothetical protein SEA_YABOI_23 [Streptomyces phage Yaboi]
MTKNLCRHLETKKSAQRVAN